MVAWTALLKQSHKKLLQARLDTGREQWSHGARLSLRTSTRHPTYGFWKYSLTPGTWAGERKTPSAITNQGAGLNWTVPKEEWWSCLVTFRGPRQSTINTLTQDHLISSFPNGSWRARLCSEHLYCTSTADVDTVCIVYCALTLLYKGICSPLTWKNINEKAVWNSHLSTSHDTAQSPTACTWLANKQIGKNFSVFFNRILAHLNHLFGFVGFFFS